WAPLAFGGTSLKVESFAVKTTKLSSCAGSARLNAKTSSATNRNFLMGISLHLNLGRILERFGVEVNLIGIPDLALTGARSYDMGSFVSNQDSVTLKGGPLTQASTSKCRCHEGILRTWVQRCRSTYGIFLRSVLRGGTLLPRKERHF